MGAMAPKYLSKHLSREVSHVAIGAMSVMGGMGANS